MNTTVLSALAEPTRLRIVELLRDDPALTVGDIAKQLELRLPQTSKHLRVLTDAGLVRMQADANRRIYSLRKEPLHELDDWLATFIKEKKEQYERLDGLIARVKAERDGRREKE